MGKASVSVSFEFPRYYEALTAALPRIERVIASTIQTQVGMRFDSEGAHNGHPKWEQLKFRQGQILSLSGDLRKSISPQGDKNGNPGPEGFVRHQGGVENLLTEIGSKIIYASVHDRGAVIQPKKGAALKIPVGDKFIFRKKVTIPARPFTDVNEIDQEEIDKTLANFIKEILDHSGST